MNISCVVSAIRLNNGFFFMSIIFQRNLVIDLPMVHMYGVGLGVQSPACDVCQDRLLQNTAYKYWTADIIGQSVASLNVTSGRSWTYNLWMARSGSARRRLPWTPKYCEHYMPVRSGVIVHFFFFSQMPYFSNLLYTLWLFEKVQLSNWLVSYVCSNAFLHFCDWLIIVFHLFASVAIKPALHVVYSYIGLILQKFDF